MSCIRKQIVIRIPAEAVGVLTEAAYERLERERPRLLDFRVRHLSYSLGNCGERRYFDYILFDRPVKNASALDAYWQARPLTHRERRQYRPIFRRLSPGVDMREARYCEYVWYDGTDAPECRLEEQGQDRPPAPER